MPVIHGAASTVAPARRWSTQINENADSPAFWSELPEAQPQPDLRLGARPRDGAPRRASSSATRTSTRACKRHVDLAAAELERVGAPAIQTQTRGESRLERVLSAVLLGDLVSVYMAVLAGVTRRRRRQSRGAHTRGPAHAQHG